MIPCTMNFMACEFFLFDFVAYEFEVHHHWWFTILVLPSVVGVVIHDCLMLLLFHHCFLLLFFSLDVTIGSPLINLSCYCCLLLPLAIIVLPFPFVDIVSFHCYSILVYHAYYCCYHWIWRYLHRTLTLVIITCCHLMLLLVLSIMIPLMLLFCVGIQIKTNKMHSTFDESWLQQI